jgi:tetratricopeptide (TPR) repeat protein
MSKLLTKIGHWSMILSYGSLLISYWLGAEKSGYAYSLSRTEFSLIAQAETQSVLIAQAEQPALVRQGYTFLEKGWVNEAINTFRQAVRSYPRSIPAKLGLAISYRRAGRIPDAWSVYQQVIAQDPNNQLALKTIGLLGSFRTEWQNGGIQALSRLLSINPNDTEARAQRALLLTYRSRLNEAVADYKIVLQTISTPDVLLGAAQAFTYSGYYREAQILFDRYRSLGQPITGTSAIAYARTLAKTGNPNAALQILDNDLRLTKKQDNLAIQTRLEIAQMFSENRQPQAAVAALRPIQNMSAATLPLARALNGLRQTSNDPTLDGQVATLYRRALANTPRPPSSLVREVADVLSGIPSQRQYALGLYRQLARVQPNDRNLILQEFALETNPKILAQPETRERLRRVLEPLPENPQDRERIANILVALDPPEPSFLSAYQSLVTSGVKVPFLNFRIAQIALQENDWQTAKRALENYRITPQGAKDSGALFLLADVERLSGNLEASAKAYQEILQNSAISRQMRTDALQGLLGVRLTQQRPAQALEVYDQLVALNPGNVNLQLTRTSLAYQAKLISPEQAETVLNNWLRNRAISQAPPELFDLVGALPASAARESLYNSLLTIKPDNIPVQFRLLQVIATRDPEAARSRIAALISRNPKNVTAYLMQAQLAETAQDIELATSAYETVLAMQPNNIDVLAALGGIRFQQQRYQDAEGFYKRALAIEPTNSTVLLSMAGLSIVQDRPVRSLEYLEQAQINALANTTVKNDADRLEEQVQMDLLRRRGFQPYWERY